MNSFGVECSGCRASSRVDVMIKYTSINEELKRRYGEKVYRVSINAGLTCPNRDGSIGTGGCIFCSQGGSGDFAPSASIDIAGQLSLGKAMIRKKAPNCRKFIAYFQAFTNTYGHIDYLQHIFMEAISDPEVVVLSIATRPDCLGQDVLDLLEKLNAIKPVWVELGLQTRHERTAELINRGYPIEVYERAVSNLSRIGIELITHVILGLPGESREDMIDTVDYVCRSGSKGIKLQLLHILKGTKLAEMYEEKPFHIMSMEEYSERIVDCLKIIPPGVIVHRITGDGPKKLLIEPKWSGDKKRVLNCLNKAIGNAR